MIPAPPLVEPPAGASAAARRLAWKVRREARPPQKARGMPSGEEQRLLRRQWASPARCALFQRFDTRLTQIEMAAAPTFVITAPANDTTRASASGRVKIEVPREVNHVAEIDGLDGHRARYLTCEFLLAGRSLAVPDD